jgi:hypothetical protein
MKRVIAVSIALFLALPCQFGNAGWAITNPINNPTFDWSDDIYVSANGSGSPYTEYTIQACTQKDGGGINNGEFDAGNYPYYYPNPTVNKTSKVGPTSAIGNGNHKVGSNVVSWNVRDTTNGGQWTTVDWETVTVVD